MSDQGSSSLLAAIGTARATASWILATLGAAAAAVLVGTKLTDFAKIDDGNHKLYGVVAVVMVAGGTAAAIFAVARVLSPIQPLHRGRPVSAFRDPLLTTMVSADPLLLGGLADGLPAFEADYLRALKMFRVAQQAAIDTPESKDTLDALKAAQETVKAYEPVSQYLRDLTLHEHMRRRFNHAIITVGIATASVIAGAVLFNIAVAA